MYVCLSVDVGIFVYMMKMQIQVISVISVVSYLVVWYGNWYILIYFQFQQAKEGRNRTRKIAIYLNF